jgi:membrane-bound serine protease (ClpP class)
MIPLQVLLIVLGIILIIAEFFTLSHLLIALGALCLIAGLVLWAISGSVQILAAWWLLTLILVVLAAALFFAVQRIRAIYRRQVTTGKEDLKGKVALVKKSLNPDGTVIYEGELWNAVSSSGPVQVGEEVIISGVKGLRLIVTKKETPA